MREPWRRSAVAAGGAGVRADVLAGGISKQFLPSATVCQVYTWQLGISAAIHLPATGDPWRAIFLQMRPLPTGADTDPIDRIHPAAANAPVVISAGWWGVRASGNGGLHRAADLPHRGAGLRRAVRSVCGAARYEFRLEDFWGCRASVGGADRQPRGAEWAVLPNKYFYPAIRWVYSQVFAQIWATLFRGFNKLSTSGCLGVSVSLLGEEWCAGGAKRRRLNGGGWVRRRGGDGRQDRQGRLRAGGTPLAGGMRVC